MSPAAHAGIARASASNAGCHRADHAESNCSASSSLPLEVEVLQALAGQQDDQSIELHGCKGLGGRVKAVAAVAKELRVATGILHHERLCASVRLSTVADP